MSVLRWRNSARTSAAAGVHGSRPLSTEDGTNSRQLDLLVRNFTHLLQSELAILCQLGPGERPQIVSSWGTNGLLERVATSPPDRRGRGGHGAGLVGRAPAQRRPAFESLDPDLDAALIEATDGPPLTYAAVIPVRVRGGARSGLIAGFSAPPQDPAATLSAAESYAELIALYLQHPSVLDRLLETAGEDGLTGCLTYESSIRELAREINRSARGGMDLSCCFIDLDGFKQVNDRHGHIHGNRVLAEVAQILRDGVRSCDTVGRYGGDEFIAILPQTGLPAASQLADRLRLLIAAARMSAVDHTLTASIGVAQWIPGTTAEELLLQADNALLAAKRSGFSDADRSDALPPFPGGGPHLTLHRRHPADELGESGRGEDEQLQG
jgi:diguanylate cyclase (GGDEF)-like protein